MGKWIHRITDVEPEEGVATCAHCGPVGVYWTGKRWQCRTQKNESKSKYTKRSHGLTDEQARRMKAGASCAICGSLEDLKVDHCHETGEIRGVLCHHCNVALGHMRDDPERLRKAADYLEK